MAPMVLLLTLLLKVKGVSNGWRRCERARSVLSYSDATVVASKVSVLFKERQGHNLVIE